MTEPRPKTILRKCWNTVRVIHERYFGQSSLQGESDRGSGLPRADGDPEQFLHPAAKWLRDHYRFLEQQATETREALSDRLYRALPRGAHGSGAAVPSLHETARAVVQGVVEVAIATGEMRRLDLDTLSTHFEAAQADRALSLAELWLIKPTVKLALFEALHDGLTAHPLSSDACEAMIRAVITSFYTVDDLPGRELTESLSALHSVLALDPAGIYGGMDFETRDEYRRAAEVMAKRCGLDEQEVGRLAIELACERRQTGLNDEAAGHVGYYLIGNGVTALEARAHCRPRTITRLRRAVERRAGLLYPGSIVLTTGLLVAAVSSLLRPIPTWLLVLLIVPATHAAVAIVNRISHAAVPPRRLPRLDFAGGIPDDCRTFVAVPTLLFSRTDVDELLERLELHYLSNRDPNVKFALLTDGPDSTERTDEHDALAEVCRAGIDVLNARYADTGNRPFYLFHRGRKWNEHESVWMGHERKRGKLNDFNTFLLGGPDSFVIKAGDLSSIADIRYVITLDRDTQLPLEAARELIGTAAHPLNRPVIDPRTNTVRQGYGILQPRVAVSLVSGDRSRFAHLFSGAVGLDPYTTAVSDVYHDLCGQGSFAGKGLYDLAAFHRVASNRFPDNVLLSHDLIEGEHARVGLVTDVEMIEDYPSSYEAYSKRKHRWTRGDWQLIRWLLPRVPDVDGGSTSNPLSALSRWKIFDNLRRSAVEASTLALLVGGWKTEHAIGCTIAALLLLNAGAYLDLFMSAARLPSRRLLRSYARTKLSEFARSHVETLACIVFLFHQTLVAVDASVRALARQFVTRRRLLEWETMAQTDSTASRFSGLVGWYFLLTPIGALALLIGSRAAGHGPTPVSLGVSLAWIGSPVIAAWMNRRPARETSWTATDVRFLRGVALRTWRYFVDWSRPDTHWLVPDNIDEASRRVAYGTSPTNIGLQLGATVAAHDFGYLTSRELAITLTRVLDTLETLETHRGHFYNWYDTRTLDPLRPRYVSTVDSGNLCVSLIAAKHACLEVLDQPILGSDVWTGLRDHVACARRALGHNTGEGSLRSIAARLEDPERPGDLIACRQFLGTLRGHAAELLENVRPSQESQGSPDGDDAGYWSAALLARIDEALCAVKTLAPFVETLLSTVCEAGPVADRLGEINAAAGRMPTLSGIQSYYDEVEAAVHDCMWALTTSDTTLARTLARLFDEIAAARVEASAINRAFEQATERTSRLAARTNFRFLFDSERKLLRVGYDADRETLDTACYGLLASEARVAAFFAIAKRDIPYEAWFHLGRTLTSLGNHRTLVSWSGTMFEYIMPLLFMKNHDNTLLGASVRQAVRIQQVFGQERGIPWGLSEAAYSAHDDTQGRCYQAFGIPGLALKRMRATDLVIAPYATQLALSIDPAGAVANLRSMASKGWVGRFGFYESIDCRSRGSERAAKPVVVPVFMAHHQGMSVVALDNALSNNAMQRRFHAEPMVVSAELLLQERLPSMIPNRTNGVLPFEIPAASHLQLTRRPEREIARSSAAVALKAS